MTNEDIKNLFHSDLSLDQVRKLTKIRHGTIVKLWTDEFGATAVQERKRKRYRLSKLGNNNPMKGKIGKLHPNWIDRERISDLNGYYRIRKPSWYTGKSRDGYAHEHVINYCETRGFTELPAGFVVHHLDMDKKNNDPRNLVLMLLRDHLLFHQWVNKFIVQRLFRKEVGRKEVGRSAQHLNILDEDIVRSSEESEENRDMFATNQDSSRTSHESTNDSSKPNEKDG